jgi:hypothetical protein
MTNNNYSLNQIRAYAESKVSKAFGCAMTLVAGYNVILDVIQRDADAGTVVNSLFAIGGLVLASGLENKLMNRDKIAKEITDETGY